MTYTHVLDGQKLDLPIGKVVCVGRNYADHAKELNNPVPTSPILFIKPASAVVPMEPEFSIPTQQGECHHELEMSLLIGQSLCNATPEKAKQAVLGYGLGLDLTLRDVQAKLKEKGHPWEIAKSFDGACPLSVFCSAEKLANPENTPLQLQVNGQLRQSGCSSHMITPVFELVAYMSRIFTLHPGDVVLTGTPAGVAALKPGDQLELTLADQLLCRTQVVGQN